MTTREKQLVFAGIVLGLVLAGLLFGLSRVVGRSTSSVSAADPVLPSREATSDAAPQSSGEHHHGEAAGQESAELLQSVQLSEDEQRSIGLQTTVVGHRHIQRVLVAAARVEEPETQLASITARIAGRIDKLHVDFTGQPIRRGQPVAEIYSPDVIATAEEYKLALENRKRLGSSAEPQALSGADDLTAASRRRLELWGLTPQQIDTIGTSNQPQLDLTIFSPVSGIVTERKVTQGQYVNAGDVLYTVTDLSNVWVKADLYEPDLPQVRVGQTVEITTDSIPGTKLHGRIGFLEPFVNAQTRTATARIQVANPGMRLRPGMFAQARIARPGEHVLAVPRSALVNTGEHTLVYVAKANSVFEAHEVQIGVAADEFYPVISGLRGGERIVTEGNFLLDSQTRLTGGMSGMFGGSKEFSQQAVPAEATTWKVTFRADPTPPRGGEEARVYVNAQEAGQAVPDAQVRVTLFMPAMPAMGMGEMREAVTLQWKGSEYAGAIKVPMSGTWTVTVDVSRGGRTVTTYRTTLNAR